MSETDPPVGGVDTNPTEAWLEPFQDAWRLWRPGQPPPRWDAFLTASNEACDANRVFQLVQLDIAWRVASGLPALLAECYFEHPRVRPALDAERRVQLIRGEYWHRWNNRERARRRDYQAAFPEHAAALQDMGPHYRCPHCDHDGTAREKMDRLRCTACGAEASLKEVFPRFGATGRPTGAAPRLDLRDHELFERLGSGGMGEVYRSCDPALERDLAIKLLRTDLPGEAEATRRFVREARVTGSLQHPGIVPVYNLGRLADGRLYYTMKRVRGRTLEAMLAEGEPGPGRLPHLLAIFEKVCQALAYAHSRGVIHRDLKPSNIMVGKFGEVQVMDWGLAKLLPHAERSVPPGDQSDVSDTVVRAEPGDTPADLSRTGATMGTPSYMPREQALGEWDQVDERADVFALGAILCEILTGRPPYRRGSTEEVLRSAKRGDVTEGRSRLAACGADAALVELCRECLAAEREERPRNAGVVAERLAAYQAEVRERLRRAELERVAAETQAREEQARAAAEQERAREALARVAAERRAKRRLLALAAALMVLVAGGISGFWWRLRLQERADQDVENRLSRVEAVEALARAVLLRPIDYKQAIDEVRISGALAEGASARLQQRAADLIDRLEREAKAADRDHELLAALLEVRGPRERPAFSRESKGTELTADEQFAAAFREWGLDVEATPIREAASTLKARPAVVVREVVAALDEWAGERLRCGQRPAEWQHLADLATALEGDPGSKRRELRDLLARNQLPVERALGALSVVLRPVPVPVAAPLGAGHARLRQLAEQTDPTAEPLLGLRALTRALHIAGDDALAEQLLRAAVRARPQEVMLYHALGQLLADQRPPRWAEVAECYKVARALRPELGLRLADALRFSGQTAESLALREQMVRDTPGNPYYHYLYGRALEDKGDLNGAIARYREASRLDPKDADYSYALGITLLNNGDREGAIASYQKAVELKPGFAKAHNNLGNLMRDKGDREGAIASYQRAVQADPKLVQAHNNLGNALRDKGDREGAIASYRKAMAVDPKFPHPHFNLGNALRDRGDLDGAIASYQKAIELNPGFADAHFNLGIVLARRHDLDGAIDCWNKVIAIDPHRAGAHYNVGVALFNKGDLNGAVVRFKRTIEIDPRYIKAHGALAQVFLRQGRYAEAGASTRKGLNVLSADDPSRQPFIGQLQQCERLLTLDRKLPAILKGEATPANAGEAITLASMCQRHKKRYAAAARLYAEAFADQPRLAEDLDEGHRYNAARAAALAGSGEGKDAGRLPDEEYARLRKQALDWLRADLTAWTKVIDKGPPQARQVVAQTLQHWQKDPDLAGLRDKAAVDKLPEAERDACRKLWADVAALLQRTQEK